MEVIEIVDLWHGRQHIWHLAHAVFGEGSAEAAAWAEPMAKALLDEGVSPVLDAIRTLQPWTEAAQEVVWLALEYFGDHAPRMRYPEFALAGRFRDGGERLQVGGRRPPKGAPECVGEASAANPLPHSERFVAPVRRIASGSASPRCADHSSGTWSTRLPDVHHNCGAHPLGAGVVSIRR